jgi:tripartite-type tricarboxylate transporter receptor subunit TctC
MKVMMSMLAAAWFAVSIALPDVARAQSDYPTKPIRIISPYAAGGPADIFARGLANQLMPKLGQSVVVESKGGAAGMAGVDYVAKSSPDGYTLVLTAGLSLVVAPAIADVRPYDAYKELAPITIMVKVPEAVVAIPSLGVKTLTELVAKAKTNPGKINFASAGTGGLPHLAGELLKREAGIDVVHVPYRGAAPAVNDMLGGHVEMMFADLPILLPQIQAGKLIPLALASGQRAPTLPDVPTTAEAGFPKVLADNWYGLLAPAGTPREIIQKLHQATVASLQVQELRDTLAKQGAIPVGNTPEEFTAYMRAEGDLWAPLAKAVGAKLD